MPGPGKIKLQNKKFKKSIRIKKLDFNLYYFYLISFNLLY